MDSTARRALALLASTQFLLIMDTAIINVAAPSMGDELDISAAGLSWIANAYLVTFGGLLLISGRAADMISPRKLFVIGLGVLVLGSVVGAFAGTASWLILARAVQGVGAAIGAASAFALLIGLFEDGPQRHRALGVYAAMAGLGGAAGTVLGGVLTSWIGWRSTFGLNILVGLLMIAFAFWVLPRVRPQRSRSGFDVVGALAVTAGLALVAYAMVNTGVEGWTAPSTLATAGTGIALLVIFVLVERSVQAPIVPPSVIRRPLMRTANLLFALGQFVLFPVFFLTSLYMQDVLGYGPLGAGLGLLPMSLTVILVASNTGRLIGRLGLRTVMISGFVLVALGMAWLSLLSPTGSFVGDVLFPTLILGLGLPVITVTTNAAATMEARPNELGLASGLVNTSHQFGAVVGLAVLSGVVAARAADHADPSAAAALTSGFSTAFLISAAVAGLSALYAITLRLPAEKDSESGRRSYDRRRV